MDEINYSLEYNRYDESPYSCADKLIRDCLHDITPDQLNEDLKKVREQFEMYTIPNNKKTLPTLFYIMQAILFQKNDIQCLSLVSKLFDEEINEKTDFGDLRFSQSYNINECSELTLIFMLTMFLLRGTDDELCRRFIDRWIAIQECDSHEHIWFKDKVLNIEFIESPLYPLMITENYELIKYFFERTAEVRKLTTDELARTLNLEGYVESAVEYQQEGFLQLLYDYGFTFSKNMEVLAYIFSNREHCDYISKIWDVRKEIVPHEEMWSDTKNRCICVPRERQLAFLVKLFRNYGKAVCDNVFNCLSPIETIDEEDMDELTENHYIAVFVESDNLDKAIPYNGIRYTFDIVKLLDRYVSQNVTITASKGRIDAYLDYLPNKNVTFDMRKCSDDYHYYGLRNYSVRHLQSVLKNCNILFDTRGLTEFHQDLLDRNSATVVKLMIKQGAFSDENVEEAVSYLVENKLFNCLAELNKMYFKEENV